jgi:putative salt-induced outer membrane protein YdiY
LLRWLLLGLVGLPCQWAVCAAAVPHHWHCPLVYAQGPEGDPGPEFFSPDVRRLPPVEVPPLPTGETLPPVEVLPLPTGETLPAADRAAGEPQLAAPAVEEPTGKPPAPVKLWKGSFELGLDGTEGNSQTLNFRFGLDAKRAAPDSVLTLDLDYRKNTTDAKETAHRAFLDWRYEWLFPESPWTCFVHGTVDYDEFKVFDVRVTVDVGLGYRLIKTESTSLAARTGGGFSHEIGSPDESYVPEAVFGLDFERRLSPRQKLTCSVEYAPDVTDFNDFRLTSRAGWEVVIDPEMNLSLKLSVLDLYDSTPGGAKPNDLDYAAVLLWSF